MKESMHEAAKRVIRRTFGVSNEDYLDELALGTAVNYDDEDQGRTPVERVGNFLWMNFSGGTTCHNAAQEIENKWREDGWVE